jgi:hypothetical protein
MGGLVARWFTEQLGGSKDVALTLTLGTPYYGAVLAAYILNRGRGTPVPLPARRLRRMARTMPGLHDLLPFYRCVDRGNIASFLDPEEVGDIGGDPELAKESLQRHQRLMEGPAENLRLFVGTDQPTMQSLSLKDGALTTHEYTCKVDPSGTGTVLSREDMFGDGTVFRRSAAFMDLQAAPLNQAHGSLAQTPEALAKVRDVLVHGTQGPPLSGVELGVELPDVVPAGEPMMVRISGRDARDAFCAIYDAATGRPCDDPPLRRLSASSSSSEDGKSDVPVAYGAETVPDWPGVYRVEVKSGGASAVVQYFMVADPAEIDLGEDDGT